MRYSQLSGQQILSELSDSYNVISAITKYQASLASGTGLPIDDPARIELMAANLNVVKKIRTEICALEHETRTSRKSRKIALLESIGCESQNIAQTVRSAAFMPGSGPKSAPPPRRNRDCCTPGCGRLRVGKNFFHAC